MVHNCKLQQLTKKFLQINYHLLHFLLMHVKIQLMAQLNIRKAKKKLKTLSIQLLNSIGNLISSSRSKLNHRIRGPHQSVRISQRASNQIPVPVRLSKSVKLAMG